MRIGVPHTFDSPDRPGWIRMSARVEYDGRFTAPEEVWFETRRQHAAELTSLANPWLAAMAPLACATRRPIYLEHPFDGLLADNLVKLSRIWSNWYPTMAPVQIFGQAVSPMARQQGRRVGCFFSAGVDSFYSIIHDRTEGSGSIEDLLLIHGADIPVNNLTGYRRLSDSVHEVGRAFAMSVVEVGTNLRETRFRETNYDLHSNSALLAACALTLGPRFQTVLIASTWETARLHPAGSHPETDPLFGTSSTGFVHHAAWASRLEKTRVVARHPVARRHLKVCWESPSADNCGTCLKCLRTMVALELLGALPDMQTFPPPPLDLARIRSKIFIRDGPYYEDLRALAQENGRTDIDEAIAEAFARTRRLDLILMLGLVRRLYSKLQMLPWARRLFTPVYQRALRVRGWLSR